MGKLLGLFFVTLSGRAQFASFQDLPYLAGRVSAAALGNAYDDLETYTDLAALNGLNGGSAWPSGYVDRVGDIAIRASDDLESYTDSAALNSLNGGNGWNGAYVDR